MKKLIAVFALFCLLDNGAHKVYLYIVEKDGYKFAVDIGEDGRTSICQVIETESVKKESVKKLEKEYEDESGWGDVKRARELVIQPKE